MSDLDIRFPPDVQRMILELSDPEGSSTWMASRGWLVVRLDDDDNDELAVCWVMTHIKVPKRGAENG